MAPLQGAKFFSNLIQGGATYGCVPWLPSATAERLVGQRNPTTGLSTAIQILAAHRHGNATGRVARPNKLIAAFFLPPVQF